MQQYIRIASSIYFFLFLLIVLINLPDALLKIINIPENIKFTYYLQDVPLPSIIIFLILHQHALPYAEIHPSIWSRKVEWFLLVLWQSVEESAFIFKIKENFTKERWQEMTSEERIHRKLFAPLWYVWHIVLYFLWNHKVQHTEKGSWHSKKENVKYPGC